MEEIKDKKSRKKKFILIGAGTLASGILGYFGWQWWSDRKQKKQEKKDDAKMKMDFSEKKYLPPTSPPVKTIPQRNDDFPLKKGSKGEKVKTLQNSFLSKYGKTILPRYGADGDFGNEMLAALKKLNLPEEIDESTFNVLTKGNAINASKVAETLYNAATSKNLKQVLFTMHGMKSTDDYTAVSNEFKNNFTINGVRQTLVNGLLNSFSDEDQKQQIRLEFSRMGLRYDGNKWALSGIEPEQIITTKPTSVFDNERTMDVPENIILGWAIMQKNGCILFLTHNNKKCVVKSENVKKIPAQENSLSGTEKYLRGDLIATSKDAFVIYDKAGICIVPKNTILGKFNYQLNDWAYIDNGTNNFLVTRTNSIKKIKK